MSKKKFVFWSYDTFPFCLGAEVDLELPDGRIVPKGYGGQIKIKEPLVVLPLQEGIELQEKINELVDAKRVMDRLHAEAVRGMIRNAKKKQSTEG